MRKKISALLVHKIVPILCAAPPATWPAEIPDEYRQAATLSPFDAESVHELAQAYLGRWRVTGDEADRAEREVTGEVVDVNYYGDMTYYDVKIDGIEKPLIISMKNLIGRPVLDVGTVGPAAVAAEALFAHRKVQPAVNPAAGWSSRYPYS